MSDKQLHTLVHHLRRAVARQGPGGLDDAQLLQNFVRSGDPAAFEVLVWRHGSVVLNVCRRVLRDAQEAEDAFQATFLVLARKARTIGKGSSLAGWLYRVAYRIALRARPSALRCGSLPNDLPDLGSPDEVLGRDLRQVLDEEVNRLPEKYRVPVVLCYLEGHTNEEAARQLGCPRGTVLSRLARGRERLRQRLTRRGLALAVGGLTAPLAVEAEAAVSANLVNGTVGAAQAFVAGKAAGLVSAPVLALTEGVLQAMFLTRIKLIGAAVLAVALTVTTAGLFAQRTGERPAAPPPGAGRGELGREGADLHGVVRSVDAAQQTVTIAVPGENREMVERTFTLTKDAQVLLDDGRGRRFIAREGKLADLAPGSRVALRLAADPKLVDGILAEGPTLEGKLSAVDATKNTLTVAHFQGRGDEAATRTYTLAKNAEVVIDDGRGRRTSLREAKLGDLPADCLVQVKLSPDQKEVVFVAAQGPMLQGVVKAVDASKQLLTLTIRPPRGDDGGEEKLVTVAADADILIEDSRPRRFFPVREGKLAEVPVGAMAIVRLAPEQNAAVTLRVEGPNVGGILKAVDPTKSTITVVIGGGRGVDGDEKTYTVAKDARIWLDGAESKLADLKVGDNPTFVSLKLSLDQATARTINVGRGR
jgi:RNA polymerase sigma factor (sigma-70 family)